MSVNRISQTEYNQLASCLVGALPLTHKTIRFWENHPGVRGESILGCHHGNKLESPRLYVYIMYVGLLLDAYAILHKVAIQEGGGGLCTVAAVFPVPCVYVIDLPK